jgi:hypothetical protein
MSNSLASLLLANASLFLQAGKLAMPKGEFLNAQVFGR